VYDMYPWTDPADSASAETRQVLSEPRQAPVPAPRQAAEGRHVPEARHVPAAAIRAVQVALDRRDNGGDAIAAADQPGPGQPGPSQPGAHQPGASQPPASRTRQ
jgi:hypothetical protein